MAIEILQYFKRITGFLPRRVLFYRDGVSEGEFGEVALNEISALKRAFAKVGFECTLTFLIVNKRHHIRFFPTSQNDADRSGNVRPGTVVDSG